VLNHGYGGGADAWYSNNVNTYNKTLAEKLRTALTADVYIMGVIGIDEKGNGEYESREYKKYKKPQNGEAPEVDTKYDAGNDRYVDENGNGKTVQEIGLAKVKRNGENITQAVNHDSQGRLIYDETLMGTADEIDSVRGELASFDVFIQKLDWNGTINKYDEPYKVEKFVNYNKNIVILFDAVDTQGYHSAVYEELNAVLDTVSFDFLSVNGVLPKYNLVGHSRGGVVNLMYATEHPYSVVNLISIDTPYYGLRYADIFNVDLLFADVYDIVLPFMDDFHNGGGQDFINLKESDRLKSRWNNMLASNPGVDTSINAWALGSAASAEYMIKSFVPLIGGFHEVMKKGQNKDIKPYDEENNEQNRVLNAALNAKRNKTISKIYDYIPEFAEGLIADPFNTNELFQELKDELLEESSLEGSEIDMTYIEDGDIWMCALNYVIEIYLYGLVNFTMSNSFYELIDGTDPNLGPLQDRADISQEELYQTIESWGINLSWLNDIIGYVDEILDENLESAGRFLFWSNAALYLGATVAVAELVVEFVPSAIIGILTTALSGDIAAGVVLTDITSGVIGGILGLVNLFVGGVAGVVVPQVVEKLDPLIGFYEGELILKTDMFIDLYSQLAPGYEDFDRKTKIFRGYEKDDFDLHNFARIDQDILGDVVEKITDAEPVPCANSIFDTNIEEVKETATGESETTVTITGIKNGVLLTDTLIIPEYVNGGKVIGIAADAFINRSNIKKVIIIPQNLSIGEGAFADNQNLETVYIINNAPTIIAENTFKGCTKLVNIVFRGGSGVTHIGKEAFSGCAKFEGFLYVDGTRNIPNSVEYIGEKAFFGCEKLADKVFNDEGMLIESGTLRLPNGLKSMFFGAFAGAAKIAAYSLTENNSYYKVIDEVLYSADETILLSYPSGRTALEYTVPDGVTEIADYAIQNNGYLKTVDLNNVETLGCGVFAGCTGIDTIYSENLEYVYDASIRGTAWFANSNGLIKLGGVLIAYKGDSESIAVEGYASIADGAFDSAYAPLLDKIYLYGNVTDAGIIRAGAGIFDGADVNRIYAANEYKELYEADDEWGKYSDMIFYEMIAINFITNGGVFSDGNYNNYEIKNGEWWLCEVVATKNDGNSVFMLEYWSVNEDGTGTHYIPSHIEYIDFDGLFLTLYANYCSFDLIYELQVAVVGSWYTFDLTEPEAEGQEFDYWIDENDNIYKNGEEYNIFEDLYLTPVWKIVVSYIIEIGIDGFHQKATEFLKRDSADSFQPKTVQEILSLLNIQDMAENYKFLDWEFEEHENSLIYTSNGLPYYTVKFNSNGGTSVQDLEKMIKSEIQQTCMPISVKGGYKGFWSENGNTKTIDFDVAGYVPASRIVTLTAVWTEKTFAECLNPSTGWYEIYTSNQFIGMTSNSMVKLMDNISLTSGWIAKSLFSGVLDGNNYSITIVSNRTNGSGAIGGLFDVLESNGVIKNIDNFTVTLTLPVTAQDNYSNYIGGIVGINYGTITDINLISGSISAPRNDNGATGGVAGVNYNSISWIDNNTLTISAYGDTGGYVGRNYHNIYMVKFSGLINFYQSEAYVNRSAGGIVGYNTNVGGVTSIEAAGVINYANGNDSNSMTLAPALGIVIGANEAGGIYNGSNTVTGYVNTGRLRTATTTEKYGFLNLFTRTISHNQKGNVSGGAIGVQG
jgi:hypothetical protein